jgi:putative restriction endonuclease
MSNLIDDERDLLANALTLIAAHNDDGNKYRQIAIDLMSKGKNLIPIELGRELFFVPSRFVGYKNNSLKSHNGTGEKDGRESTKRITKILGSRPTKNDSYESRFIKFCSNKLKKDCSKHTRKYWDKIFLVQPSAILNESLGLDRETAEEIERIGKSKLRPTDKKILISARVGQGKYRRNILKKWKRKCCITKFDFVRFLRASHVKPWCKCNDVEKLDENNGLLLTPHYDALFNDGYLTFDEDGKLKYSQQLEASQRQLLGCISNFRIKFNQSQKDYLRYHRKEIFKS